MWRRFWLRTDTHALGDGSYASDVLLANWIAALPEPEPAGVPAAVRVSMHHESPPDIGAFLVRVYTNQGC